MLAVAQEPVDDLDSLVEAADQLPRRRQRDAELLVLGDEPPGAQPELEPAVGDVVDGHRLVREKARVAERVAAHQHPDPDARRAGRQPGQERPALVVRPGRAAGLVEVIAVPHAVEAEPLEVLPALDERGEREVLVGAQPEAHSARHWGPPERG